MRAGIFISYATEDSARVEEYVAALRDEELDVWVDHQRIQPSDDLIRKINEGLATSKYAVIFHSAYYASKVWTNEEMSALVFAAIESGGERRVFVVRLDDTELPPLLAHRVWRREPSAASLAGGLRELVEGGTIEEPEHTGGLVRLVDPQTLDGRDAEAIAADILNELGAGAGDRETATIAADLPSGDRVEVKVRCRTLARVEPDLRTCLEVARVNGEYVRELRQELEAGGLGKFAVGFRLEFEKRLQKLDAVRVEIAGYVKAITIAITAARAA